MPPGNKPLPEPMLTRIPIGIIKPQWVNTLRPRQNGRYFADDIFKRIFVNENVRLSIKISPKFVPRGPINNIPALLQIMAWRRPGDKPLSETIMVYLPTHICVTRPRWVNWQNNKPNFKEEIFGFPQLWHNENETGEISSLQMSWFGNDTMHILAT